MGERTLLAVQPGMSKHMKGAPHGHVVAPSIGHLELTEEHDAIREQLAHLRNSVDGLGRHMTLKDERAEMDRVIAWLTEHIEHHTMGEDRSLYRFIEKHKGPALTMALRVEHRFIHKGFDRLRIIAAQPTPDAALFVRTLDNLIGLFEAHFEAEEQVLFPIVDELRERGVVPG